MSGVLVPGMRVFLLYAWISMRPDTRILDESNKSPVRNLDTSANYRIPCCLNSGQESIFHFNCSSSDYYFLHYNKQLDNVANVLLQLARYLQPPYTDETKRMQ